MSTRHTVHTPHCAHPRNARWDTHLQSALDDAQTRGFVERALRDGYRNMRLPAAEKLVDTIFGVLDGQRAQPMHARLEAIRHGVSENWHGRSVREHWSEYYRDTEAPFITALLRPHLAGEELLEVGTGRGWISYHVTHAFKTPPRITQTDVADYRAPAVRALENCRFVPVTSDDPVPFAPNSFDTAIIVYVLHHVPAGRIWQDFVAKVMGAVRRRVIILEDTYLAPKELPTLRFDQLPVMEDFLRLTARQQVWALSFLCTLSNRVDGGGASVPTPCTFKRFSRLQDDLRRVCKPSRFTAEFLGIPNTKVYLNAESLLVIDK